MQLLTTAPLQTSSGASRFSLSLASTPGEVREAQRLRYQVFIEAGGLSALVNGERLERDEFDDYCDHLLVRETHSLRVVGTYRVLSPQAARRIGRFYSEQEFDLSRLATIRDSMAEAGRACIDPEYRSGAVIMLLWAGLANYLKRENCQYLAGCASISLADGGRNAASLFASVSRTNLAPSEYRVRPRFGFPVAPSGCEPGAAPEVQIPPLIKGYLRGGAWVCGEPAWDTAFNCADLFLLLPLIMLDSRYARHYFKDGRAQ